MATKVVCSKCGKVLDKIPSYLGDGGRLFQCEACFYPGCEIKRPDVVGRGRRARLEGLVEDLEKVLTTAQS
jgi:hypothetical protein